MKVKQIAVMVKTGSMLPYSNRALFVETKARNNIRESLIIQI